MTPIKIPDTCKPDSTITLGYSGGMALYVADWRSFECLFWLADKRDSAMFATHIINYLTNYN